MNVYIFKCSNNTYKIGKADDIARRRVEVEKKYKITAEVYAWKTVPDAFKFENMLHRKFQHYLAPIDGAREFFNVTKQQIDNVIQEHCFTLSLNATKANIVITPTAVVSQNVRCPQDVKRIQELEDELVKAKKAAEITSNDNSWFSISYQINFLKSQLWDKSVKEDRILIIDLIDGLERLLTSYELPESVQEMNKRIKKQQEEEKAEKQSKLIKDCDIAMEVCLEEDKPKFIEIKTNAILEKNAVYEEMAEFLDDSGDKVRLYSDVIKGFNYLILRTEDEQKRATYMQEIEKFNALIQITLKNPINEQSYRNRQ